MASRRIRRVKHPQTGTVISTPVTFIPGIVSLDEPEIVNSGRGQYSWLDIAADPPGWTLVDSYYRDQLPWRAIELSPGIYDLTLIEAGLRAATLNGGRFGFRIMPFFDPHHLPEIQPSWIPSLPTKKSNGSIAPAKAPDWNSSAYLTSWSNLIGHIGRSFNGDPRLLYMDISGYGDVGEWYHYDGEYVADITEASAKIVCDAAINAFPDSFILAPAMDPGFTYAQTASTKVGSRFDYLGCMDLSYQGLSRRIADGWKIAPLVTEWGNDATNFSVKKGVQNIRDMRVSLLSSGNKPIKYMSMTATDQQLFDQANKIAGFRYSLTRIELATNLTAGAIMSVATTWRNNGVAPTYDIWKTQLIFTGHNGAHWIFELIDDLRQVLGTDVPTKSFTSTVSLPVDLPINTYEVSLRLIDPREQLSPLSLANTGRDGMGAYPVGTVNVSVGTGRPVDNTTPSTPTITSPSITTSVTPTITGTAEANVRIRVTVNGRAHLVTASSEGNWSIAPKNYFSTGLMYPISATATNSLGNTSAAATQNLEIRGTLIASDAFDRIDSPTPGNLTTGQSWKVHEGSWAISGKRLTPSPSGENFITVDAGTVDVTVSVDLTGAGASKWMGPIARYVDSGNLYMLETSEASDQLNFFKRVNGSAVYIGSCKASGYSRLALKIRTITDGVLMIAIADGIVIGHAIDVVAPFPASSLAGIHYGGFGAPGPTFDNFRIEAI